MLPESGDMDLLEKLSEFDGLDMRGGFGVLFGSHRPAA